MKLLAVGFFIFISIILFPSQAFSLIIVPSRFEIETEANVPQNLRITVVNDSQKKCGIMAYAMDYFIDKKGDKIFKAKGSLANSISKYITFSETNFILEPDERKEIKININIPEGIVGGNRAVTFFQSFPYKPGYLKQVNNVTVSTRLGATILQETKNTVITKSRILKVDINRPSPEEPLEIKMRVINESNTQVWSTGTVAIIGKDDNFIVSFALNKHLIYPNQEFVLNGKLLTGFAPGSYNALITYQFKDKSISINKPFIIN